MDLDTIGGAAGIGDHAEPHRLGRAEFERLYELLAPGLYSYSRKCLGGATEATDLVHDAFLKLLNRPLPPMDDRGVKSYPYKTATSLLRDRWRKAAREQRWRMLLPRARYRPSPEQNGGELNGAWTNLKPRERALLWLAYVEGYEHKEIATVLDLAEKASGFFYFERGARSRRCWRTRMQTGR